MTAASPRALLALLSAPALLVAQDLTAPTHVDVLSLPRAGAAASAAPDVPGAARRTAGAPAPGRVAFAGNHGQWDARAHFRALAGGIEGWVERDALALRLPAGRDADGEHGCVVRLRWLGARRCTPRGEGRLPGEHHYFLGGDPERWRARVPLWSSVVWRGIYPGVDLRLREECGHFEYDLWLAPGARLDQVVIACDGAERLALEPDGSLAIHTGAGILRQSAPRTWRKRGDGVEQPVRCRVELVAAARFRFVLDEPAGDETIVIDPGLTWATFVGSPGEDGVTTPVVAHPAGGYVFGGLADSGSFPTTAGAFRRQIAGARDAFVTRIAGGGGALVFSTFFGGIGNDRARALAVDALGNIVFGGETGSPDLPVTTGALQTALRAAQDGFVATFDPTGSRLLASTYIGGNSRDPQLIEHVDDLYVDTDGSVFAAGNTDSPDFPTTPGAYQRVLNQNNVAVGDYDGFLVQISPDARQLVYGTFFGGTHADYVYGIARRGPLEPVLLLSANSLDVPTTPGAFSRTPSGAQDPVVAVFHPFGQGAADLTYATYYGGAVNDIPFAIDVGPSGEIVFGGFTGSVNLPVTPGAFQPTLLATVNHYVVRLLPRGLGAIDLTWATFFGGVQPMSPFYIGFVGEVRVDRDGTIVITGDASGPGFPTTPGAYDETFNGTGPAPQRADAFAVRFAPRDRGQDDLLYGTFLGGSIEYERGLGLALDPGGDVVVAGWTFSPDFPTTAGAFDQTFNGGRDIFIARLDLQPTGATRACIATPACNGPLVASLTAMPRAGLPTVLTCLAAPPQSAGVVALATRAASLPVLGITLCIDPSTIVLTLPLVSDGIGVAELPLAIPPGTRGATLHAQFVWLNTPACGGSGLSASNGLRIDVQ